MLVIAPYPVIGPMTTCLLTATHDYIRNGQVKNVEVGAAPILWPEVLYNLSLSSS